MPFDIAKALEAIGNAIKSVFDFASTAKKNQAETEVIKDKRDSEKACKYAELALDAAQNGAVFINKKDEFRFKYFTKKFRRFK